MPSKAKIFSRLAQNVDLVGGVIKIDTVSLSNASMDANTQMAGVNLSTQTVPVGTIQSHSANTAPSGWLICDGSPISRTTYSDLFLIVSTTWGVGDGSSTFNLPDLRGEFLRGFDNGLGSDPDAGSRTGGDSIGSSQSSAYGSHSHHIRGGNGGIPDWFGGSGAPYGFLTSGGSLYSGYIQSAGSNETRPRNKYVQFCIKY